MLRFFATVVVQESLRKLHSFSKVFPCSEMVRRLVPSAEELNKRACPEGAPDLTDNSLAIEFEDTLTTCVGYKDAAAFRQLEFQNDIIQIGEIVTLLKSQTNF